jgi:hypothetical protein
MHPNESAPIDDRGDGREVRVPGRDRDSVAESAKRIHANSIETSGKTDAKLRTTRRLYYEPPL